MSKGESPLVDSSHDRRADDAPAAKERITVNLTGRGAGALADLVKRTGHSKTDVINRALTLYDFFETVMDEGGAVFVRRSDSDEPERVHFL
jgi:hypothetical protein